MEHLGSTLSECVNFLFGGIMKDEKKELYHRHRPTTLDQVIGQPTAVKTLKTKLANGTLPHAILLSGNSGVGKTSIARIIKSELKCHDNDYTELNTADFRGIDMIRDLRQKSAYAPFSGSDCMIWLLDEAHSISSEGMHAMLKLLEDGPSHVYFILATTNPEKLIETVRNRCLHIPLKPLSNSDLCRLITNVANKEKMSVLERVVNKIAEVSAGSARKALVLLESVNLDDDEKSQLDAIQSTDTKGNAFEIVKALVYQKTDWPSMVKIIKGVEKDEHESLRHMILACARTEVLKGGKFAHRAYQILVVFGEAWYECKESGLVRSCWEVFHHK